MPDFVHLHVHSEYSLLDGFSNIKKLVSRAKEMNMPALALTDHGTMFGVIDFYNNATAAGIKPIIGVESYLAPRGMNSRDPQFDKKATHLLLLAENDTGYRNLLKIASTAQLDGFYYYPRIDHDFLAAHAEGLICTSGCMSAEVPRLIQQGNMDAAKKTLDWYYESFGKDNFFLELQSHNIPELENINKMLVDLGRRYDARFVATNDVHYVDREDARLQDILLAVQTGCLLSDPNRMRMTGNTYYLRTPEEMAGLFSGVPDALSNTLLIAERCNVDLGFKGYHLPKFQVPEGTTPENYLRGLCESGLERRYGSRANDPVVLERLNYELGVIHSMGFDTYFLIVWDLCRYAREQGIWYNARGSAAGSMVAYTLDITMVEPIEHGLIFERFLNPGRISMPDIDLDFRDDRRADMLSYTAHKYGDDKVAQIITFGTLGARAAIRDVGRVMDIPLSEVDRVAKLVPNIPGKAMTVEQALEEVPEFKLVYESQDYLKDLIDTAKKMEGVVRNAGTHAAGVIITDEPVINYVPLHRPTGNANEESPVKTVTQFEMSILDSLGLLKVDFLGLATLTIMARACDLIKQRHGISFDLSNIPVDDPATYELMGRGETAGVFQVEGSGMTRWLVQMKPKTLAHVIAMVALFRPGPMDFIPGYIRRMHGEEAVEYIHPMLEPIFNETYGYPVYQEQLMFAAVRLAGYTPSESDDLRKAISKKQADKLAKHREKFVKGAVKNGIEEATAQLIFADWEEFARYGFNKSHAADYGVIAVQTAFLKVHYPVEYMTALLSVSQGDSSKVALYVADTRRMGIGVEPPNINASDWDFTIEDHPNGKATIRFGMGAVKNVGAGPVHTIIGVRVKDGPFENINDFARRVDLRQVGKRALECLIKVGAMDSFGTRPALLAGLDRIVSVSQSHFKAAEVGQMSMFGMLPASAVDEITLPAADETFTRREILGWERDLIGMYVSDHPLGPVMDLLTRTVTHFSAQLPEGSPGEKVRVAGLVVRVRKHNTKTGKEMGFVTLEDIQGNLELVVFPRTWEQVRDKFELEKVVVVDGRLDTEGGSDVKILVDSVSTELTEYVAVDHNGAAVKEKTTSYKNNGQGNGTPGLGAPRSGQSGSGAAKSVLTPPQALNGTAKPASPEGTPERISEAVKSSAQRSSQLVSESSNPARSENGRQVQTPEPKKATPNPSLQKGQPQPADSAVEGMPPEPESFPPGWSFEEITPGGFVIESKLGTAPVITSGIPKTAEEELVWKDEEEIIEIPTSASPPLPEIEAPALSVPPVAVPNSSEEQISSQPPVSILIPAGEARPDPEIPSTRHFLAPTAASGTEDVRMITVVLRSTGDKVRDNLRMRQVYGALISYPGNDRFAFLVYERGRGFQIEFPNFTTGWNRELQTRLQKLLGADNITIDTIKFH